MTTVSVRSLSLTCETKLIIKETITISLGLPFPRLLSHFIFYFWSIYYNELFYLLLDHLFLPACDINLFQGYQISFIINYYHFHVSSFLPAIPVVTPNYAVTAAIWRHLPAIPMLWQHLPAIPML